MRYRFEDVAYQTSVFEDIILVCCPDCHHPAAVFGGTRLTCRNCGFTACGPGLNAFAEAGTSMLDGKRLWFGRFMALPAGHVRACNNCGISLLPLRGGDQEDRSNAAKLLVTCSRCQMTQDVSVTWRPVLESTDARDPFFGAPLYLTRSLTAGKIYAYNQEHAKLMLDFVSAQKGRTDGDCPFFKSLFTVLPAWIKSGRHHGSVKRALRSMVASANSLSGPLGHTSRYS